MNRRGFLAGILAAGIAPAIVQASSIMRVRSIVLPGDAEFLRAMERIGAGERFTTLQQWCDALPPIINQNFTAELTGVVERGMTISNRTFLSAGADRIRGPRPPSPLLKNLFIHQRQDGLPSIILGDQEG